MSNAQPTLADRWFIFWEIPNDFSELVSWKFVLRVLVLLGLCFLIREVLFRLTMLHYQDYFEPVLYTGFLKNVGRRIYLWLPILGLLAFLNKRLLIRWSEFDSGRHTRVVVCFIVGMLTWRHAFYQYNFFLDQAHLGDRGLLIILFGLTFWRPFFAVPFLTSVLVIISQFEILPGDSLADSLLPLHLLIVFVACFTFKLATREYNLQHFLYLVGCVFAINYFFSGLGKANWEWIVHDQICLNIPYAYSHGWLSSWRPDAIDAATRAMSWMNVPIKVMTLGIEFGVLFFFWRLNWTRCLFLATFVFHIGIFFTSGIFFWYWLAFHAFFLCKVWQTDVLDSKLLFNGRSLVFSMLIIASGNICFQPVSLAWLEQPLFYSYQIRVESEDGTEFDLSPDYFGGYDYNFTFRNFHFLLADEKRIAALGSSKSSESFYFFLEDRSDKDIFEFEEQTGRDRFDQKKVDVLLKFIETYVRNFNRLQGAEEVGYSYLSWLKPPDLLWHSVGVTRLGERKKIARVVIHARTSYYSFKSGYRVVREQPVYEMLIDENPDNNQ